MNTLQQRIVQGELAQVLQELSVAGNNEAMLLSANLENAQSRYKNGLLDFGEWSRVQASTQYAALELVRTLPQQEQENTFVKKYFPIVSIFSVVNKEANSYDAAFGLGHDRIEDAWNEGTEVHGKQENPEPHVFTRINFKNRVVEQWIRK